MAARKTEVMFEEEIEQPGVGEVQKPSPIDGNIVIEAAPKQEKYQGPMVPIYLPKLEDPGTAGLKVDQYEHVTIANEQWDYTWHVLRGVRQDVPVPVFMMLREKYAQQDIEI